MTTRKTAIAAKAAEAPTKRAAPAPNPAQGGEAKGRGMNRQELVSAVAESADLPKAKAGSVVDAVFGAIEGALKEGKEVRLTGFGTFAVATRKASKGRNPRTGEEIAIPESTQIRFKAGKALKDALGGGDEEE